MAGTMSTHQQGLSVLARTLTEAYCSFTAFLNSPYRVLAACSLQLAAVVHLILLGLAEILPASSSLLHILVLTGLLLVVATLSQRTQQQTAAPTPVPAESLSTILRAAESTIAKPSTVDTSQPLPVSELSQFALSPREVALERQSQRLVEIADTALRSSGEAEQRSQAWADLMSRVSHELRTPLNAVIGFSDVMSAEMFGPLGHPRYREYMDHIRDSGRALLKSAEDTLALTALLAQPGSAKPEVLELDIFANEAWSFVALEGTARNLQLTTSGLDGLDVLGERRPLRQILVNLFQTAAARSVACGSIEITARRDGDLVELEIAVPVLAKDLNPGDGALSLSLARALLELQESFLIEMPARDGSWRAVTVFSAANQQDFFSVPTQRANAAGAAVH